MYYILKGDPIDILAILLLFGEHSVNRTDDQLQRVLGWTLIKITKTQRCTAHFDSAVKTLDEVPSHVIGTITAN